LTIPHETVAGGAGIDFAGDLADHGGKLGVVELESKRPSMVNGHCRPSFWRATLRADQFVERRKPVQWPRNFGERGVSDVLDLDPAVESSPAANFARMEVGRRGQYPPFENTGRRKSSRRRNSSLARHDLRQFLLILIDINRERLVLCLRMVLQRRIDRTAPASSEDRCERGGLVQKFKHAIGHVGFARGFDLRC
jgi:hypothetical protein